MVVVVLQVMPYHDISFEICGQTSWYLELREYTVHFYEVCSLHWVVLGCAARSLDGLVRAPC